MQELAILLSSIAGAASAIAVRKFPRDGTRLQSMGASSHIKSQIGSLRIEKDILNKTIARLYEETPDLSKIQRDRLLLKYQRQLGIILAKLERLEAAKRHPDLGPVGDGLITLMDQRLSQLDSRLYEISSKITASGPQIQKERKSGDGGEKPSPIKKMQGALGLGGGGGNGDSRHKDRAAPTIEIPKARKRPMEITTLTAIPKGVPRDPFEEETEPGPRKIRDDVMIKPEESAVAVAAAEKEREILQNGAETARPETAIPDPARELPRLPDQKAPASSRPEEAEAAPKTASDSNSEDDADLEKIKGDILKTLSKLEQAEVE